MKFGYARISKQDNNYYLDLQKKNILLEGVTVDNIYIDVLDINTPDSFLALWIFRYKLFYNFLLFLLCTIHYQILSIK
jgi:hypothetical protein